MELRQLRYFVAVAEERHFGRAAQRLRIATPSLSQQLRALERDLKVVLVTRARAGPTLTPAGEVLLRHARVLLARADRARAEVRIASGHREPLVLRVAGAVELVLHDRLDQLREGAAHLDVTMMAGVTADCISALREERADAAIVWAAAVEEPDLAVLTMHQEPVVVAMAVDHRLARSDAVTVADLVDETIVMYSRALSPGVWDLLHDHLLPSGPSRPDQVVTVSDSINAPQSLLRAAAAGRGVAPAAAIAIGTVAVEGIVVRPLDPPLTLPVELVWRRPVSPALSELIAVLSAGLTG